MTASPGDTLPPWALDLIDELNAADARAAAVAKTLTPHQLNWRRRPEEWSVGQCLEHLQITNDVYLRAMSNALEGRAHGVVQHIAPKWFAGWFIRQYIEPSATIRRVRAPKTIRPAEQIDPSVLDRFRRSNDQARAFVRRSANYDVNRIRFKNPFIPVLRFTVGSGVVILTAHQRRHLLQAERIRQFAEFPEA